MWHIDLVEKNGRSAFESSFLSRGRNNLEGTIAALPNPRNDTAVLATSSGPNKTVLYSYNFANNIQNERRAEVPVGGADYTFQHNGIARFAVAENKEANYVVFRRNDADGKMTQLPSSTTGRVYFPLSFSADDQSVFVMRSEKGEPAALIQEDLQTGARKTLYQNTDAELVPMWNSRSTYPYAMAGGSGFPQYVYLKPDSEEATLHRSLVQQFEGNAVEFVSSSLDGGRRVFRTVSDRDPGQYYLYDKVGPKITALYRVLPKLDPEQLADRQPFEFAARDGLKLHGFVTMPLNVSKPPVVVLVHGGPIDIADTWEFDTDAQFLANRGYAVVQVNFRGSAGRGETFRVAGYREWGGKILDDVMDGLRAATTQFGLDDQRVCAYGASYGGYAAAMLPVRAPGRFKCAVGYVGVYDLPERLQTWAALYDDATGASLKRSMGDDTAALNAISPVNLAGQIKVPMFLIHGGQDEIATPVQFKRMKKALEKAGNPPETLFEDDEDHGFYDEQNLKKMYTRLEDFLRRHINHKSAPGAAADAGTSNAGK